jgi:dipeptidyl aminopeptidase/acylaminoacyl peptidase
MIEENRRYLDFNPAIFWIQVRAPVLAMYGEVDTQVATEESQKRLQNALRKAQHRDHSIHVFPKSNHIFVEADGGCSDEYPKLSRIVPGYFQTLITWPLRHVR